MDEDDSGLYEDLEATEPSVETAEPLQSSAPGSPDRFCRRRSVLSEASSLDVLEKPCAPLVGLDSQQSFEVPVDMSDSQKHELADLLLQIQQMELRCFPELSCCCLCASTSGL